jgi:hypothetical protein
MHLKTIGTALVAMGIAFAGSALAEGVQKSPQAAGQAGQSAAFCLQKQGGAVDCKYQTMAACQSAKAGSDSCIQNPNRATTGSGAQSPATAPKRSN